MQLKLKGYNFYNILHDAETEDDIILLTYAAMMADITIARSNEHLRSKLNIRVLPLGFYNAYLEYRDFGIISRYHLGGKPINFTNPLVLRAKIPSAAKVSYLRLTSLISNDQRWRYKLWKEPILIPKVIIDSFDKRIPNEWIKINQTNIQMIEEEAYYGN